MPPSIPLGRVVDATLKAITEAHRHYEKMSEAWLWEAPEYFLTTSIAKEVQRVPGPSFITLESSTEDTIDDARKAPRERGRPKKIRNGRFDIVLWWGKRQPRGVIEVKNQPWHYGLLEKDVVRIQDLLRTEKGITTIKFGAIAFYLSLESGPRKRGSKKVEDRIKRLDEHVRATASNRKKEPLTVAFYSTKIVEDKPSGDAWAGGVWLFTRA